MATVTQRDEYRFSKGAVIFRQGDPGLEMFVIAEGRVRLTIGAEGHEKEVAVLGAGEFFGELALLSEAPRSATAQAVEDSTLLAIGRDVFAMMVQDDLDIVFRMMNIQGQRLSQTNQPLQDMIQRLGRVRVSAHALRRLLDPRTAFPARIDLAALTTELGLSAQAVDAAVGDLVQHGIGTLDNHRWSIPERAQADALLKLLCRYADSRSA